MGRNLSAPSYTTPANPSFLCSVSKMSKSGIFRPISKKARAYWAKNSELPQTRITSAAALLTTTVAHITEPSRLARCDRDQKWTPWREYKKADMWQHSVKTVFQPLTIWSPRISWTQEGHSVFNNSQEVSVADSPRVWQTTTHSAQTHPPTCAMLPGGLQSCPSVLSHTLHL